jgi:hypothetical protein
MVKHRGMFAWAFRTARRRLAVFALTAIAAHACISFLFMPHPKRVEIPGVNPQCRPVLVSLMRLVSETCLHACCSSCAVIHVQKEHALVEILAPHGARVYYSMDGTIPAGKDSMELYLGPFTLLPGMWQLVAIAKHAGQTDSDVARFPDLVCARDEDGLTIFCEEDGPQPNGAPRKGHPDLYAGQCRFPAGSRLREVTDIFSESNVTIYKAGQDARVELGRMGLMASTERDLCRQVSSREWDECRNTRLLDANAGERSLPIPVQKH